MKPFDRADGQRNAKRFGKIDDARAEVMTVDEIIEELWCCVTRKNKSLAENVC
jgi:hypothetical protein